MEEDQKPPEQPRGLTQQQKQFVADWVKEKAGGQVRPCAVCGAIRWVVGTDLVTPIRLERNNLALGGGNAYPSVPFICANCGNTHFLNSIVMNLPSDEGGS